MQQGVNVYKRVHVVTSTNKTAMLLELYEGAIRFINFAEKLMQERNIVRKGEYISRAIAIIGELNGALDRKGGGSIVWNLSDLYDYMIKRLTTCNRTQDSEILREVKGLLEGLLDAWRSAARQLESRSNAFHEEAPAPQMPQRRYGGAYVA